MILTHYYKCLVIRSSRSFFVKSSGLRWISLMLLCPPPEQDSYGKDVTQPIKHRIGGSGSRIQSRHFPALRAFAEFDVKLRLEGADLAAPEVVKEGAEVERGDEVELIADRAIRLLKLLVHAGEMLAGYLNFIRFSSDGSRISSSYLISIMRMRSPVLMKKSGLNLPRLGCSPLFHANSIS